MGIADVRRLRKKKGCVGSVSVVILRGVECNWIGQLKGRRGKEREGGRLSYESCGDSVERITAKNGAGEVGERRKRVIVLGF